MNIAQILKDVPEGTKFYSPIYGECEFIKIEDGKYPILMKDCKGDKISFTEDGKYYTDAFYSNTECVLFPSKENRDWNTFSVIKPGDILVGDNNMLYLMKDKDTVIFTYNRNLKLAERDIKNMVVTKYRKATGREVEIMYDAIKKSGFKYNLENVSIERYFEPFDPVLVRDYESGEWRCNYFSHMIGERYVCVGSTWKYCIPYNDETKHLVGTSETFV